MARLLLEQGADVNATTKFVRAQHLAFARHAVLRFCDIGLCFSWGESALHLAAAQNHTDLALLLLLHSADANAKDDR